MKQKTDGNIRPPVAVSAACACPLDGGAQSLMEKKRISWREFSSGWATDTNNTTLERKKRPRDFWKKLPFLPSHSFFSASLPVPGRRREADAVSARGVCAYVCSLFRREKTISTTFRFPSRVAFVSSDYLCSTWRLRWGICVSNQLVICICFD